MSTTNQPGMPPLGPGMARRPQPAGPTRHEVVEVDEAFRGLDDPLNQIPDDTTVEADGLGEQAAVRDVLERIDREMVGLREVKERFREISSLLLVDRLRRRLGLEADAPTLHMSFTGNPGTGKTTLATRVGEVLHALGYVRKGHLVTVTREDLVGQYVGHTAPKTSEAIKRAMGGVLFIDEAYSLYRSDNERDYGQEAVEMLLQVMENNRDDLVVIMAGYEDKMDRFFNDVPGLSSRIAHHLHFPDYTIEELMEISQLMVEKLRYRLSNDAERAFRQYLLLRMQQPRFANGRSVRNGLDRARLRQAVRIARSAEARRLTKRDLITIEAEDILGSRVFEAARGGSSNGGSASAAPASPGTHAETVAN